MEHGCGDWTLFSHKSISEGRHWCWRNEAWGIVGIPVHPKGVQDTRVLPFERLCCLGLLDPVQRNCKATCIQRHYAQLSETVCSWPVPSEAWFNCSEKVIWPWIKSNYVSCHTVPKDRVVALQKCHVLWIFGPMNKMRKYKLDATLIALN